MKHINIPIFIPQMGCPFQCIFCQQRYISHDGPPPAPSQIAAMIEPYLSTIRSDQTRVEVAFFGGSFTALPAGMQKDYLDAVQVFLQAGRVQSIRISTRPDCIDIEILDLLAERGVRTIELGVQSFDDHVLQQSLRGYDARQALEACRLIKSRGFNLGVQLMIGLPGDSLQRDLNSTWTAIEMRPDMVRLYPTLVIAGTELESLYRKSLYRALTLEEAVTITREMYLAFQVMEIPVIRMGLHPGEELRQPGHVVAGPFHPAFGELVEQAVFKEQAVLLLTEKFRRHGHNRFPMLLVNDREISKMIGWRRCNITGIKNLFELEFLEVVGNPEIPQGEVWLKYEEEAGLQAVMTRKELLQRVVVLGNNRKLNISTYSSSPLV
ncbi:MAG TPA: radical SAM protein [Syntrophomonadaceae bacterium]|nr:radical SAM protein [Syntrophomonadaceae bacterium]